jgi:hypothetical protein
VTAPTRLLRVLAAAGVTGVLLVGGGPAARWATTLTSSPQAEEVHRPSRGAVRVVTMTTPAPGPSAAPSAGSRLAPAAGLQVTTLASDSPTPTPTPSPSPTPSPTPQPYGFTISTFNALGSNHTRPGADADNFAPGRVRAGWAGTLMQRHDMSIVGFQEIQPDQLDTLLQQTRGAYDVFPGHQPVGRIGLPQSLMWRKADWTALQKGYVNITFVGQTRSQPYVLLQNNATGRQIWVMNVHNSPNDSSPGGRETERDSAEVIEFKKLNELAATGLPVFLLGDMNEHAEIFCKVTSQTALVAAQGGSNTGGTCTPPRNMRVDWIFGSQAQGAAFDSFGMDLSPLVRQTTDHALLVAHVDVP